MISIITVVLNAEKVIEETIESVFNQSTNNFEYYIMDGLSSDKTLKIAEKFITLFGNKKIKYRINSVADSGIYNAMNNCVNLVNGDYVLFLNAGDMLVDRKTIEKVCSTISINANAKAIYYGNTILMRRGLYKYCNAQHLENFSEGMPFCHQSVFTPRELLLIEPYDEKFEICADYNFYARRYVEQYQFYHMDFPISIYSVDGKSSVNYALAFDIERFKIAYLNGFIDKHEFELKMKDIFKLRMRRKIVSILPEYLKNLLLYRRGWRTSLHTIQSENCNF